MKRVFSMVLAVMLMLALLPMTGASASTTATVKGGWLRLRATPSYSGTVITSYPTGTVVTLLDGPTNNWYKVRTPDNRVGYMVADYLEVGSVPTTTAYVTNPSGKKVNLRTGPGTNYSVISSFAVGTPVTVISYGSIWSHVTIYGYTGYMMSCYISATDPEPTPTVVCYATIWSSNGYGVRLRSGPGKNYSSIGTYAVGTRVAVLQKGSVWDKITVGSRTGWMMNEFLIYDDDNQVTAVSLNNYSPSVGDTLYALSLTPSNATVSYKWYVGKKQVSTSASYVVRENDEGKSIYLCVTGTGNYTGSAVSSTTDPVTSQYYIQSVLLNNNSPVVGDVLQAIITPEDASVTYRWYSGSRLVSNLTTYTVQESDIGNRIYVEVKGNSPYKGKASSVQTSAVTGTKSLQSITLANMTSSTRSTQAPAAGDVLKVLYAPTGANVSCQWYRNGSAIKGETGLYYTLTSTDVGCWITATITGQGNYYGTLSASTGRVVERPVVPEITTTALMEGVVGEYYYFQLQSNASDVTWSIASGYGLPTGLTLNNGVISGTPTYATTMQIVFIASNDNGSSSKELTLTINSDLIALTGIDWNSITDTAVAYTDTEKSLIAELPSSIGISTTAGNGYATLKWTLTGFDADELTGYQLTAKATMTVPSGVINTYWLPLEKEITVTVAAKPVIALNMYLQADATTNIPAGSSVNLSASVSGGVPPYRYNWNVSGDDSSSILYTMPDQDAVVSLTVTDAVGSTVSDSVSLKVQKKLEASVSATPSGSVYAGEEVVISVDARYGSGSYTYLWGNGETGSSRTVYPAVTTMYSVTVSDGSTTKDLQYTVEVIEPELTNVYPETTEDTSTIQEIPEESISEGEG